MHGRKLDGYKIEVQWAKRPRREIPSYARGKESSSSRGLPIIRCSFLHEMFHFSILLITQWVKKTNFSIKTSQRYSCLTDRSINCQIHQLTLISPTLSRSQPFDLSPFLFLHFSPLQFQHLRGTEAGPTWTILSVTSATSTGTMLETVERVVAGKLHSFSVIIKLKCQTFRNVEAVF